MTKCNLFYRVSLLLLGTWDVSLFKKTISSNATKNIFQKFPNYFLSLTSLERTYWVRGIHILILDTYCQIVFLEPFQVTNSTTMQIHVLCTFAVFISLFNFYSLKITFENIPHFIIFFLFLWVIEPGRYLILICAFFCASEIVPILAFGPLDIKIFFLFIFQQQIC